MANSRRFIHSSGLSLNLTFQEWVGALRLATIFGHSDARRFATAFLEHQLMDQDPFDVIDAAKACNVDHWLQPQYIRISERQNFLSEAEGRRLGVTSLLTICQLREQLAYRIGRQAGLEMPSNERSSPKEKEKVGN